MKRALKRMEIETTKPASLRPSKFEIFSLVVSIFGAVYILMRRPLLASAPDPVDGGFVGPFCGGTRAVACILDLRFWDALVYSPLSLLFVAVIGGTALHCLVFRWGMRKSVSINMTNRESWGLRFSALTAIAFGWAYVLISGSYLVPYGA